MIEDDESWDYFLAHITQQDEFNESEKQEVIRNWGCLREFLGEDWFKKEETKVHPLRIYFYNQAPWSLRWIGELGLAIESLKKKENFEDILERLRLKDKYQAAYYELQVGYSLFRSGISYDFLKTHKKKKTPDIVLNVGDRRMFLEITKKDNPEDPLNSFQNYQKISWFLLSKGNPTHTDFVFYFDIIKPLSSPRTAQILGICEDMLEKAKKSGFEEFHLPNTVDLYILKRENIDKVPKEKRVMQGRTPDFNELARLRGTIKEKRVQLNSECPNVLLIFDSFLWPGKNEEFYQNLVGNLEETVCQFTNISAVVIYIETWYADYKPFTKEGRNYIAIQTIDTNLLRSKNKLILLNEFAKCPLLPQEIEVLKNI